MTPIISRSFPERHAELNVVSVSLDYDTEKVLFILTLSVHIEEQLYKVHVKSIRTDSVGVLYLYIHNALSAVALREAYLLYSGYPVE